MKNRNKKISLLPKELLKLRIPYTISLAGAMFEKSSGGYFDVSSGVILQDIITLIDSPAFLYRVVELRKKLGVIKVPVKSNAELIRILGGKKKGKISINEANRWIGTIISKTENWQKFLSIWNKKGHPKRKILELDAEKILEGIGRPYYLADTVMQAVLLGIVGWDGSLWKVITDDSYVPKPNVAIFINPRTTYPEVKEALKQIKNVYFVSKSNKLPDFVSRIQDYQRWYWWHLEGKSYKEIVSLWEAEIAVEKEIDTQNKIKDIGENEIIKGIKKYKSLLSF